MDKFSLFAIKTQKGFGLYQRFKKNSENRGFTPHYIVYKTQIDNLNDESIAIGMSGQYYYERINEEHAINGIGYFIDVLMKNPIHEFSMEELEQEITNAKFPLNNFKDCYVTYLGDYSTPDTVEYPKYEREYSCSVYSGKFVWYVKHTHGWYLRNGNKTVKYSKLPTEIAHYPLPFLTSLKELRENFDKGFSPEDINDDYVISLMEQYYQENPKMRPQKVNYDEVKNERPTIEWRKTACSEEKIDTEYLAFIEAVDSALKDFTDYIDLGNKAIKGVLVALIRKLNNLQESIGSLEAEELFDYIARILQSQKKVRLIETIEELREW
ncbi:MAG: hypothetical protein LBT20_04250 [Clostridiales bacterium]|jgi:hypothetical protein|nr:hypothetical protein [Clostridiales bacterium]